MCVCLSTGPELGDGCVGRLLTRCQLEFASLSWMPSLNNRPLKACKEFVLEDAICVNAVLDI